MMPSLSLSFSQMPYPGGTLNAEGAPKGHDDPSPARRRAPGADTGPPKVVLPGMLIASSIALCLMPLALGLGDSPWLVPLVLLMVALPALPVLAPLLRDAWRQRTGTVQRR